MLSAVPKAVGRFVPLLGLLVGAFLALGQPGLARWLLGVGLGLLLFNLGVVHRPRLTRLTTALDLDARIGPGSALGPAYAFSRQTSSELGPYERFILETELSKAKKVKVSRLLPLEKRLGPWLDMVNLLLVTSLFFVRVPARTIPPPLFEPRAAAHVPYPIEDLRARLEQISPKLRSEPATESFEQAMTTLDRLARGESSAEQALLALKDLEGTIEQSAEQAQKISGNLEEVGRTLERASLTRPLGKALREKKLEDAARALAELEERLAQGTARLSQSELEKLRQDLTRLLEARSESAQASEAVQASDEELRRSLAQRKQTLESRARSGALSSRDRAEKEEIERRLATLDRRKRTAEETQKVESELDKQLREAAEALSEQAQGEEQAAKERAQRYAKGASESLRQLQNKTLTDAEKQALLTELRRMKQRLGEGGPEAEKARAALRAFQERAGQGQTGASKAEGAPGAKPASSAGRKGETAGQGAEGDAAEAMDSPGERSSQPGGGHDENLGQEEPAPRMATGLDVTAAAQNLEGESDAEVVERAARRGFTSPGYRRLYLEYRAIDEEVLARDQVPPGYASRVLRYFELIEPGARAHGAEKND